MVSRPKGVLLAGGRSEGSPWPALSGRARPLLPIANVPLIAHALEGLRQAGLRETIIVVDRSTSDPVRAVVRSGRAWDMVVRYVEVDEPHGPGHALREVEPLAGGGPIVLQRADGVLRGEVAPLVDAVMRGGLDGMLLTYRVADASEYPVVDVTSAGRVVGVVERPFRPTSDLAMAGIAAFGPRIFAAARRIAPSWRGRLELADAVTRLVADGGRVESRPTDRWWSCQNGPSDLLEGNRLMLDDLDDATDGVDLSDALVRGRAWIHPTARLESTVVNGPAIIGAGARLSDAYIGPYTSIGPDAVIEGSEIEDSVVLRGAAVRHLSVRLSASVVGEGAKVVRDFALPKALRVWAGDAVEVSLV